MFPAASDIVRRYRRVLRPPGDVLDRFPLLLVPLDLCSPSTKSEHAVVFACFCPRSPPVVRAAAAPPFSVRLVAGQALVDGRPPLCRQPSTKPIQAGTELPKPTTMRASILAALLAACLAHVIVAVSVVDPFSSDPLQDPCWESILTLCSCKHNMVESFLTGCPVPRPFCEAADEIDVFCDLFTSGLFGALIPRSVRKQCDAALRVHPGGGRRRAPPAPEVLVNPPSALGVAVFLRAPTVVAAAADDDDAMRDDGLIASLPPINADELMRRCCLPTKLD